MCGWCEDGISDEDYRAYHMNVAHRDALERNLLWDVCAEHDALTPDAREYITGTRSLSEDWLLDNLPKGWSYDCIMGPYGTGFQIIAPDGSSFYLPLALLATERRYTL
jgi:hypothetical protein